jgi:S1-C subfamily serine protease
MNPQRRAVLAAAAAALAAGHAGRARADLARVIATVRASVLPVGTFNPTDNPRFGFRGTGFVVGDGTLVVTNAHVLPPEGSADAGKRVAVMTGRRAGATGGEVGEGRVATVALTDRTRDLALLKLEGPPLPALTLDDPGAVREGQSIALMGFPIGGALGFAPVTHRGIVASITTIALPAATAAQLDPRAISRLRDGNFEVLQLDATAYPGNSGGPVFDADTGRVLGVVNMVLVKGSRESALSNPTGITYAIPVRHVRALLEEYRAGSPVNQTR